jgi:chorismate-pyruvate lyase
MATHSLSRARELLRAQRRKDYDAALNPIGRALKKHRVEFAPLEPEFAGDITRDEATLQHLRPPSATIDASFQAVTGAREEPISRIGSAFWVEHCSLKHDHEPEVAAENAGYAAALQKKSFGSALVLALNPLGNQTDQGRQSRGDVPLTTLLHQLLMPCQQELEGTRRR